MLHTEKEPICSFCKNISWTVLQRCCFFIWRPAGLLSASTLPAAVHFSTGWSCGLAGTMTTLGIFWSRDKLLFQSNCIRSEWKCLPASKKISPTISLLTRICETPSPLEHNTFTNEGVLLSPHTQTSYLLFCVSLLFLSPSVDLSMCHLIFLPPSLSLSLCTVDLQYY